ncbi:DUF5908 family protein [Agriterribacter sp.]|uniref:DUF5908 family protein n=1 Tax=Agriterribacter sp. TaxID=2821509 RepID=UPI002C42AE30|nr:DUF5908 family protein [Agriterribacter sp.]HTN06772.1 DUF5908 family protein [Agriterribacter sp.]
MPIEVRELVIKATVMQETATGGVQQPATNNAVTPGEEMINSCVEKVLAILKDKTER